MSPEPAPEPARSAGVPSRLRVVLDANVLVSAALIPRSVARQALDVAVQQCDVLMSLAFVVELNDVLVRPKFDRYIPAALRLEFLQGFVSIAHWVETGEVITVCRDPKDNHILELAVGGTATYIVTGDDDLLVLDPFQNIRIVPPLAFLNRPS